MACDDPLSGTLVLLIEEDPFLSLYIGQGLQGAGADIVGPARTAEQAEALLAALSSAPLAALVSTRISEGGDGAFRAELQRQQIPVLLLRKDDRYASSAGTDHDCLTAPFASYQIVDHLCDLKQRASDPRPSLTAGVE